MLHWLDKAHVDPKRALTACINQLISESLRSAPTLSKPFFSSSRVMCPLLSASIILNISFRPAISSSDRLSAITCRTNTNEQVIPKEKNPPSQYSCMTANSHINLVCSVIQPLNTTKATKPNSSFSNFFFKKSFYRYIKHRCAW